MEKITVDRGGKETKKESIVTVVVRDVEGERESDCESAESADVVYIYIWSIVAPSRIRDIVLYIIVLCNCFCVSGVAKLDFGLFVALSALERVSLR